MKIRQGFVSNSSSSSFVVLDENLNTTAKVAFMMLSRVINDRENNGWDVADSLTKAMEFLSKGLEYNNPLYFPWSINYDTFIWERDLKIVVDTCNNHSWYEDLNRNCFDKYDEDINGEKEFELFFNLDTMKNFDGDSSRIKQ